MRCFNFSICTCRRCRTRFCLVPSQHHPLIGIRFYCCVLFIKYRILERRYSSVLVNRISFDFLSSVYCCIIDNKRTIIWKFLNWVPYVSQQRGHTFGFSACMTWGFQNNRSILGFIREIGGQCFALKVTVHAKLRYSRKGAGLRTNMFA